MALKVQYTETFEYTFKALVEFINDNWGDKVVRDFVKETEKTIWRRSAYFTVYSR